VVNADQLQLTEDRPYLFGKGRTFAIVTGVVTGIFVASINQAMLIVSVPKIVGDLGGLQSFAWIFTIYFLASTITIPMWGKLSDQYGRRPLLLLAVLFFISGSIVCALAPTLAVLFFGRALQGVGAGGIVPVGMAATADIMAPRERGKWIGYETSVLVCAQLGGPAIGGLITDLAGWRWAFLISVPFGAVSLVLIYFALRIPPKANRHQLDFVGAGLLGGALVSGLLAATLGGNQYAWGSPTIIGLFVLAAVLLVVFGFWEKRVPEPILPLALYKNRTFAAAQVIVFTAGCSMWSINTYLPLLAQGALGYSAASSGLILAPFGISVFISTTILGRVMSRTGHFRWQLFAGPIVSLIGFWLLTHMGAVPANSEIIRGLVICGFGLALGNAITIAVQNAMPRKIIGVVMAGNQFARVIGGTVMLTVLGAVMTSSVHNELAKRLPAGSALRNVDPDKLIAHNVRVPASQSTIVHAAIGQAIPNVFLVVMPLLVVSFIAAFFVERRTLRDTIAETPATAQAPDTRELPTRAAVEVTPASTPAPATQT
jgi:EmrB/QacA subfamily drug resistance transporter